MQALRAFLHHHRRLAMLLVVCALVIKAAIPAGYVLKPQGMVLTVQICADASDAPVTKQIVIPHSDAPSDEKAAHDKAPATCPYAALGFAALAAADAVLLALALAFILALAFAPAPPRALRRSSFLRPPLRGPPALA